MDFAKAVSGMSMGPLTDIEKTKVVSMLGKEMLHQCEIDTEKRDAETAENLLNTLE